MSVRALLPWRQVLPPPEPVRVLPLPPPEPAGDTVVFGPLYRPRELPTPATWRSRTCRRCGARWHSESRETPCWACGAVEEEAC